jgi:hypothetical protein
LEDEMSVWPKAFLKTAPLTGSEGELVSVSIDVEARLLESLLEALAQAPFSVNPQIYHNASLTWRYADGREETKDVTLVEFPAYATRLDEVRRTLAANGFDPASARITGMLEESGSETVFEPAAPGAPCLLLRRVKQYAAVQ